MPLWLALVIGAVIMLVVIIAWIVIFNDDGANAVEAARTVRDSLLAS